MHLRAPAQQPEHGVLHAGPRRRRAVAATHRAPISRVEPGAGFGSWAATLILKPVRCAAHAGARRSITVDFDDSIDLLQCAECGHVVPPIEFTSMWPPVAGKWPPLSAQLRGA